MSKRRRLAKQRRARACRDRLRCLTASARTIALGGAPVEFTAAGAGDTKLATFRGVAYSGGKMRPPGFYYDVVVDLAGLKAAGGSLPALLNHQLDQPVGHGRASIEARQVTCEGTISAATDAARQVRESGANDFPWQMSIGCSIDQMAYVDDGEKVTVNGRSVTGPLNIVRAATLREISFTPVGADARTSAKIRATAAGDNTELTAMQFEAWLKAKGFEIAQLSEAQLATLRAAWQAELRAADTEEEDEEVEAAGDDEEEEETQASGKKVKAKKKVRASQPTGRRVPASLDRQRRSQANELRRQQKILQACGTNLDLAARAIEEGWSDDRVELELLRASRPQNGGAPPDAAGRAQRGRILEASLCFTAGIDEAKIGKWYGEQITNQALEARWRGANLHLLMDSVIQAAGMSFHGSRKSKDFIRAAFAADRQLQAGGGFTTLSLSSILENVANKAMIASYEAIETVWQHICAVHSLSDFKAHSRYRLDAQGSFRKVGPDGELKHAGLSDAKYSKQLDTFGTIIALTRQMIYNDDLSAFLQIPELIGRMSAIRLEEAVFVLLLANPGNFFHTSNRNVLTGAGSVLGIGGLEAARTLFRNQIDPNGKPTLISPRILLTPTTLETRAGQLFASERLIATSETDDQAFEDNPHKGLYRPFTSPYLNNTGVTDEEGNALSGQSSTAWYLFADPAVRAALAVGFLNGQRMPVIESDETPFNTLGMQWRGYHDFAVGVEDPLGAVRAAGQ